MSKRVKIAVIREATLNAKPTDTHYLAESGLKIPRKDARALKGTTLYYEVLVDLGEVKGFDFIPGRDIPVYQTDSEPVLALDPQALRLVDWKDQIVEIPFTHVSFTHSVDSTLIPQNTNAPVEPISPVSSVVLPASTVVAPTPEEIRQMVKNAKPAEAAPAKRRPGRPKKVVAETPAVHEPESTPYTQAEPMVADPSAEPVLTVQTQADFEVTEKQDDESTFLIAPDESVPAVASKATPEFSFEVDEDEAPAPPVISAPSQNLGFEVEEEEAPVQAQPRAIRSEKPEPIVTPINTDDFSDVAPGLFDE
jgi:hypothetical protein